MSTEQTLVIESTNLENTLDIAEQIGRRLLGGEVIELISDLGGGKTAFVRGLVKGMGSNDTVRSPSFTISNQYVSGDLTMYHFDFYRLKEAGIVRDELSEVIDDPKAVVTVEWAEIVDNVLPDQRVILKINTTGDETRRLTFTYPDKFNYLFPSNA